MAEIQYLQNRAHNGFLRLMEDLGGAADFAGKNPPENPPRSMVIYGTALLAACHITGILLGELLGKMLGVKANVGGVGIAMMLLICARLYLHKRRWLSPVSESGVHLWGALYIPVVVAMAAQQNVLAALKGGPVALIAAVGTVVLCGLAVSFINRMEPETPQADAAENTVDQA